MHAAQHADVAMLKLLLASGARLADLDGVGFNALDYARMGRRSQTPPSSRGSACTPTKTRLGAAAP